MRVTSIRRALGCATLAAALAASASTAARAADGALTPYARLDAGIALSSSTGGDIFNGNGWGNDFGNSAVVDIGAGAAMPLGGVDVRGEFAIGYLPSFTGNHSAPNTAGTTILSTQTDVRTWTFMANGYVDIPTSSAFTPYLGAGLGVASNHLKPVTYAFNGTASATETGMTKTNFAWSLAAGVGYKLGSATTLDLGYRYLDAGDVASSGNITLVNGLTSTQPPVKSKLKAHELTMGIRLSF
jgi:opacity protein-like surface antigen